MDRNVSPDIAEVLQALKRRIQRYVLLEGLAAVVALLGGLFWLSFAADLAWFRLSRLELPLWFRWGFTSLALLICGGAIATWLLFRLLRSFSSRGLALVLERRFPRLDDRLVTAVELADALPADTGSIQGAMLARTMADAAREARALDLAQVFDPRPLRRAVTGALLAVVSIGSLGVANAAAMQRWFDAYVIGRENYWDPYRQSELVIQIIAQPGDRLREFDSAGRYKHPRGADLTLLVTVQPGKRVPAAVTLRSRAFGPEGSSRGAVSMSQVGERQFRHTLARVIEPHELWVVGGDFTNRTPLRIDIVEPPKVDRIELLADYPSYTGMDSLEDQPVLVQGTRVALPMETEFVLHALANKPLVGVQIRSPRFQLQIAPPAVSGDAGSAGTLTIVNGETRASRRWVLPPSMAERLLPGDRRTIAWQARMSSRSEADLQALLDLPEDSGDAARAVDALLQGPFPLSPDQPLQFYLEDEDGVLSFEPAMVTIQGVVDQPPAIEAQLTGIDYRITRLATIPLEGRILDDYGVAAAWFTAHVAGTDEIRESPLANPPAGQREFELRRSPQEGVERFDVVPLQLEPGRQLTLTLHARDADNLNGPHAAAGRPFAFEIVSEDALLGDLYEKEMNLRLRFEHIREEVESVRTDLLLHRGRYTDGVKLRGGVAAGRTETELAEELRQIGVAVRACADRSLHLVRKNHAETRDVEARFRQIRAELVNNRVDTAPALQRLDQGIIAPLAELNRQGYPAVDEAVALFGLTLERSQDPTAPIDAAVVALDRTIAQMDRILEQMRQRKGFNEVIQELQVLLQRQQGLLEATEQERQRSVIEDLFK